MSKLYYKRQDKKQAKKIIRYVGLSMAAVGFLFLVYFSFPLLSWKIYLSPVYASQGFTAPIPKTIVLNRSNMQSLLAATINSLGGVDYSNAQNWFPAYKGVSTTPKVSSYTLTIPNINITDALVSTVDNDVDSHLVNFGGTAVPPEKGNAVVFGHSTLPQLFNPKNYKTIFAYAHTLKIGDQIVVNQNNISYTYTIFSISIVPAGDTSPLAQEYDDSYITLITCTPPGTVWERLIVKGRLEKL